MGGIGKTLVVVGLCLAVAGALLHLFGDRIPLGRLPGDIAWKRKGFSLYVPITTCIVLSIVLSVLARFFFRNR
ncbi:MAG: DUF2905 domain-containing protein [bacterium]